MASRFSACDRAHIEAMTRAGLSASEVAEALSRHHATVYRELNRGSGPGGYNAGQAQEAARLSHECLMMSNCPVVTAPGQRRLP